MAAAAVAIDPGEDLGDDVDSYLEDTVDPSIAHLRKLRGEEDGPLGVRTILIRIITLAKPSVPELQQFRLVNRLWYDVTLDMWRESATLILISDSPVPPDTCTSSGVASPVCQKTDQIGLPISEFLSYIVDPSDPYDLDTKPFSRVKLKGLDVEDEFEFTGTDCEIINVFPRIWDLIGPLVVYLHCEECTFENAAKLGAFKTLVLERTPFLRELVMTNTLVLEPSWEENPSLIVRYDSHLDLTKLQITGDFPMELAHFLPYIPNVEDLSVKNSKCEFSSQKNHNFFKVWEPIHNLRHPIDCTNYHHFNIKRLDVMDSDTFKISFNPRQHFREAALPLEMLSVSISPFEDFSSGGPQQPRPMTSRNGGEIKIRPATDIVYPMLKEHERTLTCFKLFRPPFSEPFTYFPYKEKLENMEELHLLGNITNNLNFLKCMPNLQVLYVNTICYEKWDQMKDLLELDFYYQYQPFREDIVTYTAFIQNQSAFYMKTMQVLHIELQLQPESICTLAEWFPNLRAFSCILDKITFRGVCAFMPRLEELTCLFGSEVDTGTVTGVAPGTPRDPANITSLTRLRSLTIHAYCGKAELKDRAVYLGFAQMRRLQKLQVCVGDNMSKRAEKEAKAAVPETRFIRNSGPGPHLDYECCRRVQFVKEILRREPNLQSNFDRVFSI